MSDRHHPVAAHRVGILLDEGDPLHPAKSAELAIALKLDEGDPLHPAKSAELAIALKLRG
jgi:hypothetical protein